MDRERYAGRVKATDDNEGTLDKLLRATKEHLEAFPRQKKSEVRQSLKRRKKIVIRMDNNLADSSHPVPSTRLPSSPPSSKIPNTSPYHDGR